MKELENMPIAKIYVTDTNVSLHTDIQIMNDAQDYIPVLYYLSLCGLRFAFSEGKQGPR